MPDPEAWARASGIFLDTAARVGGWAVWVAFGAAVVKLLGVVGSAERVMIAWINRKKGA